MKNTRDAYRVMDRYINEGQAVIRRGLTARTKLKSVHPVQVWYTRGGGFYHSSHLATVTNPQLGTLGCLHSLIQGTVERGMEVGKE